MMKSKLAFMSLEPKEMKEFVYHEIDSLLKEMYVNEVTDLSNFMTKPIYESDSVRFKFAIKTLKDFYLVEFKNPNIHPRTSVIELLPNGIKAYELGGIREYILNNDSSIIFKKGYPKIIGSYGVTIQEEYLIKKEFAYNESDENAFRTKYLGKIIRTVEKEFGEPASPKFESLTKHETYHFHEKVETFNKDSFNHNRGLQNLDTNVNSSQEVLLESVKPLIYPNTNLPASKQNIILKIIQKVLSWIASNIWVVILGALGSLLAAFIMYKNHWF